MPPTPCDPCRLRVLKATVLFINTHPLLFATQCTVTP